MAPSRNFPRPHKASADRASGSALWNRRGGRALSFRPARSPEWESEMGLGKGALLWMLGIPLPIIIVLALFWHH
jgi:hypothetical protein